MNKLLKWVWISCFILVVVMATFEGIPNQAEAAPLLKSYSMKITVIDNGTEYEWEYTNPTDYEYEQGERVIKNEAAKTEVEKMVTMLDIKETTDVEDMIAVLKDNGFEKIERLDVRWINGDNKLFTWVWDKN